MNKIGFIISISSTAVIFILEFVFGLLENQKVRKSIKPFCLISLMVSLFFFGLRHPLVYIALGCGLLGDIFLIWPKNKILFFLGIISFFINHILYIVLFSMLLSYTPPVWSIIALWTIFWIKRLDNNRSNDIYDASMDSRKILSSKYDR